MRILEILSLLEICYGGGLKDIPCNWQGYLQSIGEIVWVDYREVKTIENGWVVCVKPCVLHSKVAPYALLDKGTRLKVLDRFGGRFVEVAPIEFELRLEGK